MDQLNETTTTCFFTRRNNKEICYFLCWSNCL